jgi:putative ABC transport system permease protein
MKYLPPNLFLRFFRWYCHPKLRNHIEGDLIEILNDQCKTNGKQNADRRFIIDVLLLFRPGIIKPVNNHSNSNRRDMVANYLKVGFRNILKYKVYSGINLFGLAIGMAASLLIILYIADELSYDRFQKDADRIFRIASAGRFQGSEFNDAASSSPIAEALMENVPEVEQAVRFGWWRVMPMRYAGKSFVEKKTLVADSNFFRFFSFPLISGDPVTALQGVNKVVITESSAKRYFGAENPIGKIILRGEYKAATEITGIAKDPPLNSHIQFDMVFSGQTSGDYLQNDQWSYTSIYTYIKMHSAADASAVKNKLDELTEKNMAPELEEIIGMSQLEFKASGNSFEFFLQPLLDIHLESDLGGELTPNGNKQYLFIFGAVAAFILSIACINFMNLSTARSATRAKEVGVRKSIGALRSKLIIQFLSESMIYSFMSTILALAIIGLVFPAFNALAGKNLELSLLAQPVVIISIVGFALATGLIAGSYPAFYLTAFKPIHVLKGNVAVGLKNSSLRNSLVVFQFIISISLILGSIVVYKQLKYMQSKDMGFDKENIIVVNNLWSLDNNEVAFKNELSLHREFVNTSFTSALPPRITDSNLFRKGGSEKDIVLNIATVDHEHLSTMHYTMSAGRFFSPQFPSDSTAIVLNEAAYKQMGFDGLEGATVINFNAPKPKLLKLIGVVRDFNFESLRSTVKPMAMVLGVGSNAWMVRESKNEIAIRMAPGDPKSAIEKLEGIWKKYSSSAFEFSFLDQNIEAMFRSEQRMGRIVFIFASLAIIIACLGLFGLANYLGEQRGKEISIRKVLGASVPQVVILLLKDFTLLIVIAFVIAAPLGWYLMSEWLDGFAYRTSVNVWLILAAGSASLLTALFTISYQSLRVAHENPVNNLKGE